MGPRLISHWTSEAKKYNDCPLPSQLRCKFKANSCEKFEAKISEKSEKKGNEYLKCTSESHVKRISVRLLLALKRKNFLSETGAPY